MKPIRVVLRMPDAIREELIQAEIDVEQVLIIDEVDGVYEVRHERDPIMKRGRSCDVDLAEVRFEVHVEETLK